MSDKPFWYCTRQRAGPLVKECRALRPRLSANDTPYERTEKNKILRPPRDSSVCRTRVDRLELRLALFGFEGSMYTLSFDPIHLPATFPEVRNIWRRYLYQLRKWHHDKPFDYVYLIEGKAYCPITAQLTQNQFDALVSFTYNCGGGCLKTLCKDRTAAQIAAKLPLYKQERGAGRGGPNAAQNGGAGAV